MKERLPDIAAELERAIKHWNNPEHTACLDKGDGELRCCAGFVGPSCTTALSKACREAVAALREADVLLKAADSEIEKLTEEPRFDWRGV